MHKLSYRTLLIILFFLLISIVVLWKFVLPNHKVEASWWNDGWNYRKAVSISNTSGSNLTDFQISLSIGTSALIASGKMQNDCDDIRITDINGNLLPYWVETGTCNTDNTRIWTKINSLPSSGSITYVYYGNASVSSQSDSSVLPKSCSNINPILGNGNYYIDPDQSKNTIPLQVYCDMTIGGGGWTLLSYTNDYNDLNFPPAMFTGYGTYNPNSSSGNASLGSSLLDYIDVYDFMATDLNKAQPYVPNGKLVYINNYTGGTKIPFGCLLSFPCGITCGSAQTSGLDLRGYSVDDGIKEWSSNNVCASNLTTSQWSFGYSGGDWLNSALSGIYLEYYNGANPSSARRSAMIKGDTSTGVTHKIWVRESTPTSINYTTTLQSEEAGGGPIAYWKFDEGSGTTAYDSTTNQNNGTLGTGNSAPTWADESQCISGKCLSFDGNDYLGLTDTQNSSLDIKNQITMSVWVRPTSSSNLYYLISKNSSGGYSDQQFSIAIDADNNQVNAYVNGTGVSHSFNDYDTWSFISATWDGSYLRLYQNGKLLSTASYSGTLTFKANFSIGRRSNSTDGTSSAYTFYGYLDDVKIYPYARTADQIKKDYNSRGSSKGTSANLGGAASDNNLSDGLVGYWKMDEGVGTTTADSSGNSGTGTLTNTGWTNGKFGIGTSFNGTSSYIGIGKTIIPTGDFSISSWFYATDSTSYKTIVGQYASGQTGRLWFGFESSNFGYRIGSANQTISVDTNKWVFTTITRQNDQVKMYINGELKNTSTASDNIYQTNTYIGSYDSTGGFFAGTLDEVRIYNRALSPFEVTQLYEYAPGPVGYWDFEENTGTVAKDKSGNNNNGTLNSSSSWTQGKYGSAGNFNGTSDRTGILYSPLLSPAGSITFGAWAYKNNWTSAEASRILSKTEGGGYALMFSSSTVYAYIYRNGAYTSPSVSTIGLSTGWHYFTGSYDGRYTKIYVDGILKNTDDAGANYPITYAVNNTLFIGAEADSNNDQTPNSAYFTGKIDDVKIYNYARTQKQIIEDMNGNHPAVSSKSMIGYWKFDEGSGTTANNSGNGGSTFNTTFATGSSAPTWTNDGKFGKALNFDGVGNYALTNSDPANNLQEMTISTWVKPDSVDKTGPIVGNVFGWYYRYGIFISGGTYTALFRSTGGTWSLSSSVSSSPNNWDYVAVSYKDGTAKIYVNGKLRNSGTFTYAPLTQGSSTIMFGTHSVSANDWFKGSIDEVKIYNYALTDDEIKKDYNQGSALQMGQTSQTISGTTTNLEYCIPGDTSPCASPVAEWNFEENTGTTTKDSSGNNNTGTISGATWTIGKKNIGAGLKFDGVNDYVNLGTPTSLNSITYPLTISLWAKPTTLTQNGVILSLDVTDSNSDIAVGIYNNENKILIGRQTYQYGLTGISSYLTAGKWQHWEIVFTDTTHINFYLDGVQQTLSSVSNYWTPSQNNIGAKSNGSLYSFNGSIDGVKIYNYARTPAQVAYDYNKGGPIGWWKLDECQGSIANDSSGIGNTGSIIISASGSQTSVGTCTTSGTAWGNGASGKINSSLNFDGTDDYIDCGNNTSLNLTTAFTLSTWLKTNNADTGYIVGRFQATDAGYMMRWSNTQLTLYYGDTENVSSSSFSSSTDWTHAVITFDNGTVKFYRNSIPIGSTSGIIINSADSIHNTISNRWGGSGTGHHFAGQIDDVRIYNYALTTEQVKTLYNGGAVSFN